MSDKFLTGIEHDFVLGWTHVAKCVKELEMQIESMRRDLIACYSRNEA